MSKSESKPRARPRRKNSPHRSRGPALHQAHVSCRHRRIVPGTTYLITKKTNDDLFWLVPCPLINAILLYLLLIKAAKYGVLIHAFKFMSNHFHLVVTDTTGSLPEFMREFGGESCKAIQRVRRTSRSIWSRQPYSAVTLLDLDAVERAIAYVHLNSMEAGLTEPGDWPGLTSATLDFGDTIKAKRPEIYFDDRRPEFVTGTLAPLSRALPELSAARDRSSRGGATERGDAEGRATERARQNPPSAERAHAARIDAEGARRIRDRVAARCDEIRRDLAKRGESLAGAAKVMRTPVNKRTTHPIRELNPRFASRDKDRLELAVAELRRFELDHERAKQLYIAGRQKTLFPLGTYGYRVVLGVRVAKKEPAA